MAKKKKFRRTRSFKIPLGATLGIVGWLGGSSATFGGTSVIEHLLNGEYYLAYRRLSLNTIGSAPGGDGTGPIAFELANTNYMPLIIGVGASVLAAKFKVNRFLKDIPFVKI